MAKLEWLRSFVATAENSTYEAAAVEIGVAQPTVWKHVKDLSTSLDLELFFPKSTRLTGAGEELLLVARDVVERDRQFTDAANALRLGLAGVIRVACYPAHVRHFLGSVAGGFKVQFPQAGLKLVSIESAAGATEPALVKLREAEVDLAIGPRRDEFHGEKLYETRLVVAVNDNDPLRKRRSIDARPLRDRDLLVSPPGHSSRLAVDRLCRDAGFEPRIVTESASWTALLSLGENGLGIPIVHDDTLDTGKPRTKCPFLVDSEGRPVVREAWIQWRKNEKLQPIVQNFVDFAIRAARSSAKKPVASQSERRTRR